MLVHFQATVGTKLASMEGRLSFANAATKLLKVTAAQLFCTTLFRNMAANTERAERGRRRDMSRHQCTPTRVPQRLVHAPRSPPVPHSIVVPAASSGLGFRWALMREKEAELSALRCPVAVSISHLVSELCEKEKNDAVAKARAESKREKLAAIARAKV
mmetsp:Transcript_41332/g.96840  ORF Transcript_41332/g.96840 Transcript_41332/m.96840 type:complete len:159 (+) Transcript_41332:283-759(+)